MNPLPHKLAGHALAAGQPWPLGATWDGAGVNFALFSANARRIELCLFSPDGASELARIPLEERDGDIWHVRVEGLGPGTVYGYRAHGPYAPHEGHRFNPAKLLLDPYARALTGEFRWHDAVLGYRAGDPLADLSRSDSDSAPHVQKAVVTVDGFDWQGDRAPRVTRSKTLIYEANVRGLTRAMPGLPEGVAGSFAALGSDRVIEHLTRLGVTTLELLPVAAHLDERFLHERGLRNLWGYNTLAFFAPAPRLLSTGQAAEAQEAVRRLHQAGIEVVLDVVFNHSAESNELGPTLSFRGLDNASYYLLAENPRYYVNHTGTGNTLNLAHPAVLRLVMDCLRHWVSVYHVDGFRFDLATVLAREGDFAAEGGFLKAIRQDPVLAGVKLIAEPWDLGPGGYRLGQWPHPFHEWNDRFRDGVRRFWRGDPGQTADLATRLAGSAEAFDRAGRAATSSVNFITAHDGFTLEDLVSHATKRNAANGEGGRDGRDENYSEAVGGEGAGGDQIRARRDLRKRNLLATLFLAQGTPMLLAGDETGNSQGGNNNAYAQDNPTGWVGWSDPDTALAGFVARLARLRRDHPVLRQRLFLHARERDRDNLPDLYWRLPSGAPPSPADWQDPTWRTLCVEFRTASATPEYAASDDVVFAVFNAGPEVAVSLPELPQGMAWQAILDTTEPEAGPNVLRSPEIAAPAHSVLAFCHVPIEEPAP